MPKRSEKSGSVDSLDPITPQVLIGDEDFVASLRHEMEKARHEATQKVDENRQLRVDVTRRLLQDYWEVHNLFDEIGIHMTIEPAHTTFAVFEEFPVKWSFKSSFDFASLPAVELHDRTPGWVGDTLRAFYYTTQEGKSHLRMIFEWCEGETYQRYSGWMRIITQVVLYDAAEPEINLSTVHGILKDVVVAWHSAHLARNREKLLSHLREKYPKGSTQAKGY